MLTVPSSFTLNSVVSPLIVKLALTIGMLDPLLSFPLMVMIASSPNAVLLAVPSNFKSEEPVTFKLAVAFAPL